MQCGYALHCDVGPNSTAMWAEELLVSRRGMNSVRHPHCRRPRVPKTELPEAAPGRRYPASIGVFRPPIHGCLARPKMTQSRLAHDPRI